MLTAIGIESVVSRLLSSREDIVDQVDNVVYIDFAAVIGISGVYDLRGFIEIEMVILSSIAQSCDAGGCLFEEIDHEVEVKVTVDRRSWKLRIPFENSESATVEQP